MRNERMLMKVVSCWIAPEMGPSRWEMWSNLKTVCLCKSLECRSGFGVWPRFDSQHRALHVVVLASTVQFEVLLDD